MTDKQTVQDIIEVVKREVHKENEKILYTIINVILYVNYLKKI